jgi:hypothetical protein
MHFLNKMGGGGGYLGEDLHEEEGEREWSDQQRRCFFGER